MSAKTVSSDKDTAVFTQSYDILSETLQGVFGLGSKIVSVVNSMVSDPKIKPEPGLRDLRPEKVLSKFDPTDFSFIRGYVKTPHGMGEPYEGRAPRESNTVMVRVYKAWKPLSQQQPQPQVPSTTEPQPQVLSTTDRVKAIFRRYGI